MASCSRQEVVSFRSGTDAPRGLLCPRRWRVRSAHVRGHGGPTDRSVVLSLEDGMCWRGFWLFFFFLICNSDHVVSTELCCSN